MTAVLRVEGVDKRFHGADGGTHALHEIGFEVEEGEFFTLIGPSGCGKTTLLRSLAGLETPDAGLISIGDLSVFDSSRRLNMRPEKRPTGMVFQSYAIWPHMNVFENVAFPLRCRPGRFSQSDRKRVSEILEIVGLGGYERRNATDLSGGQQQRLALGRALVGEPRLLLLDEPLSNLDALLRVTMRAELKRLQREVGITTVYVTHDQSEALSLSDRIAVFKSGQLLQVGSPEEVYNRPAQPFVGEFLGGANAFDGSLVPSPSSIPTGVGTARSSGGSRVVGTLMGDALTPGDDVRIVVRPDAMQLSTGNSSGAPQFESDTIYGLAATINQCMFNGSFSEVMVDTADGFRLNVIVPGTPRLTLGDSVTLTGSAEQTYIYRTTGAVA
ncbi:MAG: transporter related protein [Subtercola sp.]|nr:transporter related protein [Subtercola sp.]